MPPNQLSFLDRGEDKPSIFDYPRAHRNDPVTSYTAAENAPKQTHGEIVLATIRAHQGKTAKELAQHCRLTQHQIARRCRELVNREKIKEGYVRECTVEGGDAVTWWVERPL